LPGPERSSLSPVATDRTQAAIFGLQQGVVPLGDALRTDRDTGPPG
jgi:hypothetical protein